MKSIIHKDLSGNVEEFHSETFKQVLELVKNKQGILILERWDRAEIGYRYVGEVVIGNISDNLTEKDYNDADDQLELKTFKS